MTYKFHFANRNNLAGKIAAVFISICALAQLGATDATINSPTQQSYEGFTEPIRKIEVAASESARVADAVVKRGAVVKKGDVLMQLDTKLLEASLRVAQAKASASARIDALRIEQEIRDDRYTKIRALQESGAGSPEETKRAKADASVAALNVQSALEDQMLSQLEVAEIEARIEQRRVRAPISGVVTEVIQEPGEYVSLTEPHVATVVQLDTLRVNFFIPTDLATSMYEGQRLQLQLPGANPPETKQVAVGEVQHIAAVTAADSGRVRIDVLIENPQRAYRSGVRCIYVTN